MGHMTAWSSAGWWVIFVLSQLAGVSSNRLTASAAGSGSAGSWQCIAVQQLQLNLNQDLLSKK